jgi:C-terminal processing protease CtpA/Prc
MIICPALAQAALTNRNEEIPMMMPYRTIRMLFEYQLLYDVFGMVITEIDGQCAALSGMEISAGLIVMVVWFGDAADLAGVETGDIVSEVDGKQVTTLTDFQESLARHESAEPIRFLFRRAGIWRCLTLPFKDYTDGRTRKICSSIDSISRFNTDMSGLWH